MSAKKIIMWCGEAPNHRALANKIHKKFGLAAIVIDQKKRKTSKRKESIILKVLDRLKFGSIYDAWKKMQKHYASTFAAWPDVPLHFTPSINTDEASEFSTQFHPDLVIVSGTALVKEKMLGINASIGIINLHTGLSPYVKGGPNCTNWCIANNEWHLIGNTVMWINAGIDSGNIIVNEPVNVRNCNNLFEVQLKVMEHAHDIYIRAIEYLVSSNPPYISVSQSELGDGKLYLTKHWTGDMRSRLLKNWRNRKKPGVFPTPRTISLPSD